MLHLSMKPEIREIFQEKFINFSNFLTLTRILILPGFVYMSLVYKDETSNTNLFIWILIIITYSIMSDFFDGMLARKLHQETKLGQYLDPVADKLTSLVALGVLTLYFKFPLWIYLCIIGRDLIGVWAGSYIFFKRGTQGKPNMWGKVGVTITAILVLWYISLPWYIYYYPQDSGWITHPEYLAWFLLFILVLGILDYKKRYWDLAFYPEKHAAKMKKQNSGS